MKTFLFLLCIGVFPLLCLAQKAASPSLQGKVYHGMIDSTEFPTGCEGCGQPGYFKFQANNQVEYLLPGSDIIEEGPYKQTGRWVYIYDLQLKFNAGADTLVEQKCGTPFVLEKNEN